MGSKARPTSRDVAQAAGVSQSTVSIVLAGKWPGRISPATARAVQNAAERIGYRPNPAARNLRLGRTRTILLVIPTLAAQFFGELFTGVARTAAAHGFAVVVYPADQEAAPYEAIDGVILSSVDDDVVPDAPRVRLDNDPSTGEATVNLDVAGGMRDIAAHLTGLGHRHIAHLAAGVDEWTFRVRAAALDAALPDLVRRPTAINARSADAAARDLLRAGPTALICDDDVIAAGAHRAARALGLSVPGDVSITGFDDGQLAEILDLTTVRLPAELVGDHAMRALLDLLDGRTPENVSLPGELIVRASTAPPSDHRA